MADSDLAARLPIGIVALLYAAAPFSGGIWLGLRRRDPPGWPYRHGSAAVTA